ncbi:MAG: hypothetical protein AB7G12_12575 [Thermoanaerobaculia bacterium]
MTTFTTPASYWSKPRKTDASRTEYGERGRSTWKVSLRVPENRYFAFELRRIPFPHWLFVGSAATAAEARALCEQCASPTTLEPAEWQPACEV